MVEVFRAVRRVLRDDGTLWLNLGDSYANVGFRSDPANNGGFTGAAQRRDHRYRPSPPKEIPPNLKPKDLVGIPWRVAFALQADSWYLRSDIIWAKPNPMPESVTDRPTKAHEYIFLLSKNARYYYDGDAIKTQVDEGGKIRSGPIYSAPATTFGVAKKTGNMADDCPDWRTPTMANRRSVWTIPTQPFAAAHFAVFPPALVEPCILAGAPEGGTVLDPFAGSGTVGVVCRKHRRRFIGIELNPEYAAMARGRLGQDVTSDAAPEDMPLFHRGVSNGAR
jgi:DNA modification methylase